MLRSFLGVAGVSGLLLLAPLSTAGAADMPVKAPPPPPPAPTWTGCYLSAGFGYGLLDDERTTNDPFDFPSSTSAAKGWLGAFGGGCDYQFGSGGPWGPIVIGAFADWDPMDITGNFGDPFNDFHHGTQTLSDAFYVGGRAGVLVTPTLLAYIDGGWTGAHIDAIHIVTPTGGPTFGNMLAAANPSGGFIGGGYEYALPWLFHGLFWKTEYRLAFYDNYTQNYIHANGLPGGAAVTHSIDVQTITSSLVWRFNWLGGH